MRGGAQAEEEVAAAAAAEALVLAQRAERGVNSAK
jgi:hypothetical protein